MDRFCGLAWSSVVSPWVPGSEGSGGDGAEVQTAYPMRIHASWRVHECGSEGVLAQSGWPALPAQWSRHMWGGLGPQGRAGWGPLAPAGAESAGSPLRLPLDRVYPHICATHMLPQPQKSLGIWANPAWDAGLLRLGVRVPWSRLLPAPWSVGGCTGVVHGPLGAHLRCLPLGPRVQVEVCG